MIAKLIRRVQLAMPIVVAAAITLCNMDVIVAPTITWTFVHLDWRGRTLAICLVSSLSILYIHWFVRWFSRLITIYEDRGQSAVVLRSSPSRWDRLKARVIAHHQSAARQDNLWVMRVKMWGWPVPILVGIIPEFFLPGVRTVLISFCGTFEWRLGFVTFLLADVVKNIGWSAILGKLFHE